MIDFIDMTEDRHRDAVLAKLHEALLEPAQTQVDVTFLGLVQLSRRRTRESLVQVMCTGAIIAGTGMIKTRNNLYGNTTELAAEGDCPEQLEALKMVTTSYQATHRLLNDCSTKRPDTMPLPRSCQMK